MRPRWWDDLSSGNRQKSDEMCSSSKPHCAASAAVTSAYEQVQQTPGRQ